MVEISKIVEQNPWWRFGMEFRHYDKTLKEYEEAVVKIKRREVTLKKAPFGCKSIVSYG